MCECATSVWELYVDTGICYRTLWEVYICTQCANFAWMATCSRLRSPELPLHHLLLKSYQLPTTVVTMLAPVMDYFHFSTKPQKLNSYIYVWNDSAEYNWYVLPSHKRGTQVHIVQQYLWEFYICGNISSAGSILSLGILYLWELFIHNRLPGVVCLIQLQLPLFPEFSSAASPAP